MPIPPAFAASGLQLGLNALTSGINSLTGEDAARQSYARQLDFWNRQNEYNLPINQRRRLESAGLSTGLMYSGGAAGSSNAGGLSTVQPNQGAGKMQAPSGYMDVVMAQLAPERVKSEIELNNANARAALANAGIESGLKADNLSSSTAYNNAMATLTHSRAAGQDLDNWLRQYTASDTVQQADLATKQARTMLATYVEKLNQEILNTHVLSSTNDDRVNIIKQDLRDKVAGVAVQYAVLDLKKQGLDIGSEELNILREKVKQAMNDTTRSDFDIDTVIPSERREIRRDKWYGDVDRIVNIASKLGGTAAQMYGASKIGRGVVRPPVSENSSTVTYPLPGGGHTSERSTRRYYDE